MVQPENGFKLETVTGMHILQKVKDCKQLNAVKHAAVVYDFGIS